MARDVFMRPVQRANRPGITPARRRSAGVPAVIVIVDYALELALAMRIAREDVALLSICTSINLSSLIIIAFN